MTDARVHVNGLGWVLPFGVGSGAEILDRSEWLDWDPEDNARLADFSARPYLKSVKGYLDPAGAYCLAAASLALDREDQNGGAPPLRDDAGISTTTMYGAPASGYRFYEQFLQKGARFASPLLFPHGYANTAGNLAAIEFGFGGPHLVLYGGEDCREALDFALTRLAEQSATCMFVGAYEAVSEQTVPDGTRVLNGGIVMRLDAAPEPSVLLSPTPDALAEAASGLPEDRGSVHAMLCLLQRLGQR